MWELTLILVLLVAATALYLFVVEPLWVLPVLEWLTPNVLYRVRTEKAVVALSFDDGPHAEFTPQVLEILERFGATATFFLIGERAERHPGLVRRILNEGHEIGNHCWKDGSVLGYSGKEFVEKLEATERAIEDAVSAVPSCRDRREISLATSRPIPKKESEKRNRRLVSFEMTDVLQAAQKGRPELRFFRAPGGVAWPWQLRLTKELGYTNVLGCAYPHDPMRPPVKYMRWLIEKNLRPGTIVILHDGISDARKSIEVLPQILKAGKDRGLRFASIGELIESA